ncbi:MAG: integrase core domain-containing protein [Planctomycetota bacterium]
MRPSEPRNAAEAKMKTAAYVEHYNTQRLHSVIGFITPEDRLAGRSDAIPKERDRKLEAARAQPSRRRPKRL